MGRLELKNPDQVDRYTSPWSKKDIIKIRIWSFIWNCFVRWLPKFFSPWYVFLLKIFGCKISGKPVVSPSCKIYAPWLLELGDKVCLAPNSEVYNLGPIRIDEGATISQYAYLCNGSHDFDSLILPLLVGDMVIEKEVFITAKAIILPGLTLKQGCVIGAGAVVTKDTIEYGIYGGNPAKLIRMRQH